MYQTIVRAILFAIAALGLACQEHKSERADYDIQSGENSEPQPQPETIAQATASLVGKLASAGFTSENFVRVEVIKDDAQAGLGIAEMTILQKGTGTELGRFRFKVYDDWTYELTTVDDAPIGVSGEMAEDFFGPQD